MSLINKKTGIVFVLFTSNNTLYSLTNFKGDVLFSVSLGIQRTKGLKKVIPSAIQLSTLKLAYYICKENFTHLHLKTKGVSKAKKLVIKTLSQLNLRVITLQDITSFPHNGCRKKRRRRV
uniref:ribosomal protein S11 n=1 Tax=Batrachospermum sp. TaxID=31373 RepID=UPI001FA7D313|nr:ribosomal protein S11 [Batrachospermum sp.]UNB13403.1 ribosomal protein S11 [Batrachospermum sp.]